MYNKMACTIQSLLCLLLLAKRATISSKTSGETGSWRRYSRENSPYPDVLPLNSVA